jgi:hypothetical protein
MEKTKDNRPEFILKNAPGPYPATAQQVKMREVAKKCGITKGMKKADLMTAMKDCVGPAMKKEE